MSDAFHTENTNPEPRPDAETEQELAAWARKAERRGAGKLSSLHWRAAAYAAEHGPSERERPC